GSLLALLVLPFAADAAGLGYYVGIATRILIFALAAVGLDLVLGFGGMVSFGHAAFVGIGAYAVGILSWHVFDASPVVTWPVEIQGTQSALVAWPAAIAAGALFALVVGAISLRTAGVYFIMITLAFAQMLFYFAISLRLYGGEDGITLYDRNALPGLDLFDPATFYYLCLAILVLAVLGCRRLVNSRFGMVLRGCRENERRMQALGFPTYRYKLAAFVLSGAIAGLAGALLANATEFAAPAYMTWQRSGELIVMVVLGGMGTVVGPVFGAAALLLLEEVLAAYTEHWQIFLGPILLLVVLFARRGLWGWIAGREQGREQGGDQGRG
ncbi:MAG TPA: branched-chain amino acid ABC transporter permease, partial [Arenibaculum sp.]|nr:branched-chain amino acid ABC transporter permease [Arenibaculum sp.]